MNRINVIAALVLLASSLGAQTPEEFVGRWVGEIAPLGLEVEIDLDHREGAWRGDISIPVQGLRDQALVDFALTEGELRFRIADLPGRPTLTGKLAGEGARLAGTMVQGSAKMSFDLSRRATPQEAATAALEGLDAWINEVLGHFETPGLALAIVVDGKVLRTSGFGFADLEAETPVTERTRFAIGSSTKAFTAFGLATLVAEGKLDWDKPLRGYLPGFEMKDPAATLGLTARDLVTHRSGLPRHDLVWYNARDFRAEDLLRRLPHLEPSAELRQVWQYNNLMFVLAGHLASVIEGADWEAHLHRRVLGPLGMSDSLFAIEEARKGGGAANPYGEREGDRVALPYRDIRNVGPAGSLLSSARDMSRWLQVMLGEGMLGEKRILEASLCRELMSPQMVMPSSLGDAEKGPASYGMGWMVDTFRGHARVHHGGNIDGYSALVSMFPADGIGVVVLVNQDGSAVPGLVTSHIADLLLELKPKDRVAPARRARAMARRLGKKAQADRKLERKEGTKPAHPLADYAGDFDHPAYGRVSVTLDEESLVLKYNDLPAVLEHWHYETFSALPDERDPALEGMKFLFVTDLAGEVAAIEAQFEPTVEAIRFQRAADPLMEDPAYLDRLVGRYALPNGVVTVTRAGKSLSVTVPGQPTYALVPERRGRFRLKGLDGFSLVFEEKEGKIEGARFVQPNGVFRARRLSEED
jgi:CubicO group peptidase (beta-lactamase class C family)